MTNELTNGITNGATNGNTEELHTELRDPTIDTGTFGRIPCIG
jgi:hypothetical protein